MNKSIPFVANSVLFVLGIIGIILKQPYLCAVSMLAISLLFIWFYGMASDTQEYEEETADDSLHDENVQLSKRIQELSDSNNKLVAENGRLSKELEQARNEKPKLPQPHYLCPLTCSLPVNLNNFFAVYTHNYENIFESKGVQLEYNCQAPEAQTYLSESALNIICNNIFDNMLKFTPQNDKVYLRISKIDEDSLLIFKNAGDGLGENEINKIFETNFQGSNSKYGNGLGLAQVKTIVDDFGGSVWSKSTPDTGFALYLQIPEHQKGTAL
jgi:signal transduction histidine kinase